MKNSWVLFGKIILALLLSVSIYGFFYFETSLVLKVLVVIMGLGGFLWGIKENTNDSPLSNKREVLILLILYLSLGSIYNLLYSLGIPLAVVMISVCFLVFALFGGLLVLDRLHDRFVGPRFWVFVILAGIVLLEIFLSLAFWPIDPKFKSLILVIVFYGLTNVIYLYAHDMLKLKRIINLLIVCVVILALIVFAIFYQVRGG